MEHGRRPVIFFDISRIMFLSDTDLLQQVAVLALLLSLWFTNRTARLQINGTIGYPTLLDATVSMAIL